MNKLFCFTLIFSFIFLEVFSNLQIIKAKKDDFSYRKCAKCNIDN